MLWISVSLGFLNESASLNSGVIGYEINQYLQLFIGKTGLGIILLFLLIAYLTIRFKITPELLINKFRSKKVPTDEALYESESDIESDTIEISSESEKEDSKEKSEFELSVENLKPTIQNHSGINDSKEIEEETIVEETVLQKETPKKSEEEVVVAIDVEEVKEEENVTENLSEKLVKDFGEFDPTLELGNFKFPTLNLLKQYN